MVESMFQCFDHVMELFASSRIMSPAQEVHSLAAAAGSSLRSEKDIGDFEAKQKTMTPWLYR